MNELSMNPESLVDFVRGHRDDADATETMAGYLPGLVMTRADWGDLEFSGGLHERWTAALTHRGEALDRLRERMSEGSQSVIRAAAEFAELDASGARRLRVVLDETDSQASGQSEAERLADGRELLAELAGAAGLSGLPTAPVNRESPGSEELMSCRAEHLTTLERAEGLLRDGGLLDFTAPSEYLRRLAPMRPGTVGGRVDPLSTLACYLDEILARHETDASRLTANWRGEAGEAFGDHARITAESLRDSSADLRRLSGEAEELWRLLDTLLHDVAEAIWGRVAAVGESRIARIGAAVELVDDVNGFAGTPTLWGGLSADEVDAAIELLYKRVWYLSDAMATLVSAAGSQAAPRLGDAGPPDSQDDVPR